MKFRHYPLAILPIAFLLGWQNLPVLGFSFIISDGAYRGERIRTLDRGWESVVTLKPLFTVSPPGQGQIFPGGTEIPRSNVQRGGLPFFQNTLLNAPLNGDRRFIPTQKDLAGSFD